MRPQQGAVGDAQATEHGAVDAHRYGHRERFVDFVELTKPNITFMVLITTLVGFYMGSRGGINSALGLVISSTKPSINFGVWWDADPLRELLDSNHIDKWNFNNSTATRLLTASECSSNNGTKATPALSADILGDWREEVIWRTSDNTALHIYTTTIPATNRIYTLMHDRQYRLAIAWQNTAYNQPPHPSFYLGDGMSAPPTPNIVLVGASTPPAGPYPAETAILGGNAVLESTNGGFNGTGYVNFPATGGFLEFGNVDGGAGGSRTLRIRFALGITTSRTGRLLVNGASQNITFDPTGSWTTWANKDVVVTLRSGTNIVRFESTGQDLANIDELQLP